MICRNIGDCSRKPTNGTFSSKMQSKYHSPERLHTQTKTQTVSVMQTEFGFVGELLEVPINMFVRK
jgi:hypothetical protein